MKTLIGIYENALSDETCDFIVDLINRNPQTTYEGQTGSGINKKVKISTDIDLYDFKHIDKKEKQHSAFDVTYVNSRVFPETFSSLKKHLIKYCKENNLVGPWPNGGPMFGDNDKTEEQCWERIREFFTFDSSVALCKKYNKNEGHFNWHCDKGPPNDLRQFNRACVCMFYLNDVDEGGETEFYSQNISIKPKKGTLVIFPSYFTHLHRGKKPISNDKYICNFWFLHEHDELSKRLEQFGINHHAKSIFNL